MSESITPEEALALYRAEESLYSFFKQAWPWIEGTTPLIEGWHIGAIADHLQACYKREIKNLMIHVPPRSSKTSLISIAFPAWAWIHNPQEKFLYASYAGSLSLEHSLKCRRLIESPWYQERWGVMVKLSSDQNAKGFFDNTAGGYRIATSVGASATGRGGSILVCDDPNNAKDGESEVKRDGTNQWYSQVWSTRLNNAKEDIKIIVQQRIHEQDLSGYILAQESEEPWVQLILPNEFEESRRSRTIVLPLTNGKVWQDPRKKEGDLLCSTRFGKKETDRAKRELGSYGYAGQYQQRPAPADGGIFKKSWFKWWKSEEPPQIQMLVQSWDTAYSEKPTSDYSACTTWGVWEDHNGLINVILMGLWRGRVGYEELRKKAKRLHFDYRDTGEERNPAFKGREMGLCLVEATGFGDQLIKDLRKAQVIAIPFIPQKYGDKTRRAHLVCPIIEGGIVWLPAQPPDYKDLKPFAQELERYATIFPKSDSRDVIDTMTQALIHLNNGFHLNHPHDPFWDDPPVIKKPVKVY
jgi:phage terminase large subunit-like protein